MLHYIEKELVMVSIHDLECPGTGKSHKQINDEKQHNISIGQLVEIENGCRLFVAKHKRDCDGTPLYSLSTDINGTDHYPACIHGFPETSLKIVEQNK